MNIFLVRGSSAYVCASFSQGSDIDILSRLDFENVRFDAGRAFKVYPTFDDPVSEGVVTDFPYSDMGSCLVLSARAADVLGDIMLPSGPFCDIEGAGFEGYKLFACFRQLDALDPAVAEFHTFEPRDPFQIKRYGFKPEAIAGIDVFRTKPLAARLFVSDRFKERVTSAGLTGLRFQPLWSSEAGPLAAFDYLGNDFDPDPETAHLSLAQMRKRMRQLIAERDAKDS